VTGVAKSRFRTTVHAVPVLRGSSARPLFVTAAGLPAADAADLVRRMAGRYRHALIAAVRYPELAPMSARAPLSHEMSRPGT
jgi:hypothetical protein